MKKAVFFLIVLTLLVANLFAQKKNLPQYVGLFSNGDGSFGCWDVITGINQGGKIFSVNLTFASQNDGYLSPECEKEVLQDVRFSYSIATIKGILLPINGNLYKTFQAVTDCQLIDDKKYKVKKLCALADEGFSNDNCSTNILAENICYHRSGLFFDKRPIKVKGISLAKNSFIVPFQKSGKINLKNAKEWYIFTFPAFIEEKINGKKSLKATLSIEKKIGSYDTEIKSLKTEIIKVRNNDTINLDGKELKILAIVKPNNKKGIIGWVELEVEKYQ